jgi:hypothetical protein
MSGIMTSSRIKSGCVPDEASAQCFGATIGGSDPVMGLQQLLQQQNIDRMIVYYQNRCIRRRIHRFAFPLRSLPAFY